MLTEVRKNLTILFGTQTGNAEDVSERISRKIGRLPFVVSVQNLSEYPTAQLINEEIVIFVCSTTGQGEVPDDTKRFWKFLLRKSLPVSSLRNLRFSIVGLGDSSYEKFNVVAKRLNKRLLQLGATELCPLALGDDQHELGYDAAVDPWLHVLCLKLLEMSSLPNILDIINDNILIPPKYRIRFQSRHEIFNDINLELEDRSEISSALNMAKLKNNSRITAPMHFQSVHLVEFDIKDTDIHYEPGDIAVLQPCNHPDSIEEFLTLLHLPKDELFILEPTCSETKLPQILSKPCTVRQLATLYWDIQGIPRRSFFELLWHFSKSDLECEKIQEFASTEGQEELYSYCNRPRRSILEVLQDFPNTTPYIPLEYLFDLIPRIRSRSFSIASSQTAYPNELDLLVAVVQYKTRLQKPRRGLCSTWLANMDPNTSITIPLSVKKGSISLPPDDVPIIMIGPGTGCAPFRSFIQERISRSIKDNYLFFGCRNRDGDFLCASEWQTLVKKGFLSLYVAFSRDQEEKIYVQHKMMEQSALLWTLINNRKAWVYIAGRATQMPQDVKYTLQTIFEDQGSMDKLLSKKYLTDLEKKKRLQVEAWS